MKTSGCKRELVVSEVARGGQRLRPTWYSDGKGWIPYTSPFYGRMAQWRAQMLYTHWVTGSSPVPPIPYGLGFLSQLE